MVKWVKSEDWPDSKPIILRVEVPIIAFEDPTSFVIVLRSRPIPIDVIQCRTADTGGDIGIHIAVVSLAASAASLELRSSLLTLGKAQVSLALLSLTRCFNSLRGIGDYSAGVF